MASITLYHNPHSRSTMTRALLEELGVDYAIETVDFRTEAQRAPAFLAINPMGKVPTIRHGDAVVTEAVAIFIYLADRFPQAALAPALDDADRGAYLRWLVFYAACFEPAVIDRALKREPAPRATSGYGDYQSVLETLEARLAAGTWLLGERFSAADVLWGHALAWVTGFGLVEATPVIGSYIDRVLARPAAARAKALDRALAGAMGLAV